MPDGYRSYVIRVRRRDDPPGAVQLVVEELLGGIRIVLTGEPARKMADDLQRIVTGARPDSLGLVTAEPAGGDGA